MNKQQRRLFFERLKAINPYPATELHYHNVFELLVAVILSAQATDSGVNKATHELFKVANTPQAMLALGEDTLKQYIKSINFYPSKARHLIQTCQILIAHYHGEVPDNRDALEQLPGVGRKTANVVLNTAFGQLTMPVDTHIFRVANRTGLARCDTPRAVEDVLLTNIEPQFLRYAHHWLVLHGRYICTARKPHCYACPVVDLCEYPDKNFKEAKSAKKK